MIAAKLLPHVSLIRLMGHKLNGEFRDFIETVCVVWNVNCWRYLLVRFDPDVWDDAFARVFDMYGLAKMGDEICVYGDYIADDRPRMCGPKNMPPITTTGILKGVSLCFIGRGPYTLQLCSDGFYRAFGEDIPLSNKIPVKHPLNSDRADASARRSIPTLVNGISRPPALPTYNLGQILSVPAVSPFM